LTFWRQGWILDPAIFIIYFVRLPLCNKYSDYCDIYLYTLYDYICCLLWRMYEMHPALSLKARGVTAGCVRGRRRQGQETVAARENAGVGVKICQMSTPIYRSSPRVRVS
jgi:hypothetical protein